MKNLNGNKIGNVVNLMIDGNAFQKTFVSQDEANAFFKLMYKARNGDKQAYDDLMSELNSKHKTVIKGILEKDANDNYYLKDFDIKMPELLANTFLDYIENDFPVLALQNFWKLLITNPDTRVREDLFDFLKTYNFSITDNGYFIAYKRVVVKENAELDIAAFVTNQYLKIKKQKKSPQNYNVLKITTIVEEEIPNPNYDSDEYDASDFDDYDEYIVEKQEKVELKIIGVNSILPEISGKIEVLGNLSTMFNNIDQFINNRTVYRSMHRGVNGHVEQVLGVPVKQDRSTTDSDPTVECSSGLHVGSTKYVEAYGRGSGKVLLVLVNPAHVVAVPKYDKSKMRTCEYFPYAELEEHEDGTFEVIESSYFEDDYMGYEKSDLEDQISKIKDEMTGSPTRAQLDYSKILKDRLITIEQALAK